MKIAILSFVFCALFISPLYSFKFLGVFPTTAKSHWNIGYALAKGLADAGHQITVITPFKPDKPVKNLEIVHVSGAVEQSKHYLDLIIETVNSPPVYGFKNTWKYALNCTTVLLEHPNVRRLLESNEKFDAVIVEIFLADVLFGFGSHFDAPLIGVSTFGASRLTTDLVGAPTPLSYVPHPLSHFSNRMSIMERIWNVLMHIVDELGNTFVLKPAQDALYDKYFSMNEHSLDELRKNVSLVLLNSHFSLNEVRPFMPNMIEVGGLHLTGAVDPLPDDVKEFIDGAPDGVIYFSLGSNLEGGTLPRNVIEMLTKAFGRLRQRVLWKYEDPVLPNKPRNVMIKKWFPQTAVLAHHKVEIFISHGGLLSIQEAVYHGKPIIGIPMFGDQIVNVGRAQEAGYALMLPYYKLSEESLLIYIKEMLDNYNYMSAAKRVSKLFRDQPMRPIDTAVYWIEYVARHKGAKHMKSVGMDLNFMAYHNLDAYLGIFVMVFSVVLIVNRLIHACRTYMEYRAIRNRYKRD